MSSFSTIEEICERLNKGITDTYEIVKNLKELREHIETLQVSSEYNKFLSIFIPSSILMLKTVPPKFEENTIRKLLLEIIGNIPNNELLKPYINDLAEMLLNVLEIDNEENALISLRILVDLFKNFRMFLENYVQPFINIVFKMYSNFGVTVDSLIENNPQTGLLPHSLVSFRVLTECPIVVVLLFQLHRKFLNENIPKFIPLIVQTLTVKLRAHCEEANRAIEEGYLYVETNPELQKRANYADFVAAQVKTLSFLAYIIRGYSSILRPFQSQIPEFVIYLLRICPGELSSTRKELLVASRHIVSSEFRDSFIPFIEYLLHEKILIGNGITAFQIQRSLSFSLLADLVHHLRMQLPSAIISRIIAIYTRNLHDNTLPMTIQTMSAKLLLNLMDCILSENILPEERRPILMIIFHSFIKKFVFLKSCATKADEATDKNLTSKIDIFKLSIEASSENSKDIKLLMKTLMSGMKSVLFGVRTCSSPPGSFSPQQIIFTVRGFNNDEVESLSELFVSAIECFQIYVTNGNVKDKDKAASNFVSSISPEEKDIMEQFASVFTVLDAAVFQDLIVGNFDFLFEQIAKNYNLLTIPQYFLAISGVSNVFASLLLRWLTSHLDKLEGSDSQIILRLFKLVFLSVTVYPDENEVVLQPYLSELIMACLKNPSKSSDPINYFLLLRSLFRSIGGGRFELLYKEVLPLLPVLLEGMNDLLETAQNVTLKELFVELCLTTPVRLSVLLPYLSHLMKPLVLALQAGTELVSQGLRTLELCIDNLTQDFLDPLLLPVIDDLMKALWQHLKPPPYNQVHAQTTLRILGKLSGRNRRFFRDPPSVEYSDSGMASIDLLIKSNTCKTPLAIPLDDLCKLSYSILEGSNYSAFHRRHAFQIVTNSIASICSFSEMKEFEIEQMVSLLEAVSGKEVSNFVPKVKIDEILEQEDEKIDLQIKEISRIRENSAEFMFKLLVKALFISASIKELENEAKEYLMILYRHFALIKVLDMYESKNGYGDSADDDKEDSKKLLDVLVECLIEVVAMDRPELYPIVEEVFVFFYESCMNFCLSKGKLEQIPIFFLLSSKFCSLCYQKDFYIKRGGCFGISIVINKLNFGVKWMLSQQLKYVRALLYILKDHSTGITACNIDNATKTLYQVLKICNRVEEDSEIDSKNREIYFTQLSSLLVSELSNSNGIVREIIQTCLQLLADLIGSEVTEILQPVKEKFLIPIFTKPLRALPFQIQIGNIDAVSYCLSLRPPLLTFNDELMRLIQEALALADAEDHALISRPTNFNLSLIISLRMVCLKLLSTAMSCADFHSQKQSTIRNKIVTIFFKSLYSKANEIVEVSKKGLEQVMVHQSKLPRDLLQHGLRPVLMNLSEYKRLTVSGLEGLGRLLGLLNSYFKVEIGNKLLEHLKQWAEPATLEEASVKPLLDSNEMKIIVAIVEVFHLLPPSANIFLADLVDVILHVEKMIRRSISSPLRGPLLKYLNRYYAEAIDFFFQKIDSFHHFSLFFSILQHDQSLPLKIELSKQSEKLVTFCLASSEPEIVFRGLKIVKLLSSTLNDWLANDALVINSIVSIWNNLITVSAESSSFSFSPPHLDLEAAISNCKETLSTLAASQFELFFEPIRISITNITDYALPRFYSQLIQNLSNERKEEVALKASELCVSEESVKSKLAIIKMILIPCLSSLKTSVNNVVEKVLLQLLVPMELAHEYSSSREFYFVELSQLLIDVLTHFPNEASSCKTQMVEFCFKMVESEDPVVKQAFYVVLSKIFAIWQADPNVLYSIITKAVKSSTPEIKMLCKKTMDLIIPSLISNYPSADLVRFIKTLIINESHSVNHLMLIWPSVILSEQSFFEHRDTFIPSMVSSMVKIGCTPGSSTENKLLAIELGEVICEWDFRSRKENSSVFGLHESYADILIICQIRLLSSINEEIIELSSNLASRCFCLIEKLVKSKIVSEANIKLNYIEKLFSATEVTEENSLILANLIKLLIVIVDCKSNSQFASEISQISKIVELALQSDNSKIISNLSSLIDKIYQIANHNSEMEYYSFVRKLDSFITESIQNSKNLTSVFILLKSEVKHLPEHFDSNRLSALIKLFQKLVKDLISSAAETAVDVSPLKSCISLLKERLESLGELRIPFLNGLQVLSEKCNHPDMLKFILEIATEWVLEKTKTYPTAQEKISLVVSLESVANLTDKSIYEAYLLLLIHIYCDSNLTKTETISKLERSFLLGMAHHDVVIRERFFSTFEKSLQKSLYPRMKYLFANQSWESLNSYFWIFLVLRILLHSLPVNYLSVSSRSLLSVQSIFPFESANYSNLDLLLLMQNHSKSLSKLTKPAIEKQFNSIQELLLVDIDVTFKFWTKLLPACIKLIDSSFYNELNSVFVKFLSQSYHIQQQEARPNCIQAMLEGLSNCNSSEIPLSNQLVKYLGKTFNAWYPAIRILERNTEPNILSDEVNYEKEAGLDGLADLYQLINEDDFYFGLWRRRCLFPESNCALAFDQNGMWESAQMMYENVQTKARNGLLPFSESEYYLWESRWVACAARLQQWDVLVEISKIENNRDLNLECSWRLVDWSLSSEVPNLQNLISNELPSPRRKIFEAFLNLLQLDSHPELLGEYQKACDDGILLALKKWYSFPQNVARNHLGLLHSFQHYVELQEAHQIYSGISMNNVANRAQAIQELKGILSTWRDRLPNMWDDINVWSDLVSWRKHIFSSINHAFEASIIEQQQAVQQAGSSVTVANSFAFRGFHETAWIINRFAHVARKHGLIDVCLTSLNKIYTLPNIEIQDAFLKLREQAKCYLMNTTELPNGLEVINATNLGYFGNHQKAEFFTLKSIFLSKMGFVDEANKVFAQAVQIDLNLAKGWAAWGKYNDERFQATNDISWCINSINCYLQAASLNRNSRARNYLARILWLLTFEDAQGTLSKAFDLYNNDLPIWYWITFIPQLLTSLTRNEAKQARFILIKIAKSFPQALYFVLRTFNEDFKQAMFSSKPKLSISEPSTDFNNGKFSLDDEETDKLEDNFLKFTEENDGDLNGKSNEKKTCSEHTEDLLAILKTGYPLLALSMENMVEHIIQRLRSSPDEDLYRIIVTLLYESFQQSMLRLNVNVGDSFNNSLMEMSLQKVADMLSSPNHFNHKYKDEFQRDFVTSKPTLSEILRKLRHWRDRLETVIKRIPKIVYLENFSRYLIEFEHQKYEDIEVPGQYLLLKDGNSDFIKIDRFEPEVEIVRKHGTSYRKIAIRGNDSSVNTFIIQNPGARHARREERVIQIFRMMNNILDKKIETRKRNLSFNVPLIIPLSSHVRMIEDDPSFVSLEDVYEDYCQEIGILPDHVFLNYRDSMEESLELHQIPLKKGNTDVLNLRMELFEKISTKIIPDNVVYKYFMRHLNSFEDFFVLRKQVAQQMGSLSFLTYVMSIGHRFPHKMFFSKKFGSVMSSDLLPTLNQYGQFTLSEAVPFRLTPNIQKLIGPVAMEGVFTASIFAIANAIVQPEFAMEDILSIFVRDELLTWNNSVSSKSPSNESEKEEDPFQKISQNVDLIRKRAQTLACLKDQEKSMESNIPMVQSILDLISCAVNPQKLSQMDPHWHPWL